MNATKCIYDWNANENDGTTLECVSLDLSITYLLHSGRLICQGSYPCFKMPWNRNGFQIQSSS